MPLKRLTVITLVMMLMSIASARAEHVLVAVAANFTDAARDIASSFERASGHTIKVSFGSTGKLFSQIDNGAPFEVFLAADSDRPRKAEKEGLAVPGTRFSYAQGKLVLWSAAPEAFEDGERYLKEASFARAAIANPKTAPYGKAAKQVMEHLGIWDKVQARLVRGESIAQTFQFTATSNAKVGFVAYSQVKSWKSDAGSLWKIPESYYSPIAQHAVLLIKGQTNPAALAFLEFLKGPEARAIITGYGYSVE